jgi:hypothetical protein
LFLNMMYKAHKMENKNQKNLLIMAVAGIGLWLFFKKKSTTAPVVPPTTGGGSELQPIAPSPVYEAPVQPIYTPSEPITPSPISALPVFTNPISEIISLIPVQQYPSAPIYEAPVYTRPEPIYNFPVYETPAPELKGSIEVGPIDVGEYGGGGGGDYFVSTPSLPVYQPPIEIYIPPIAPTPELKGTIEIGPIDVGQYGPAEDMPTDTETPPMSLSMFDNLLFNPQQSTGGGGGGGSSAGGGDFGGGGGGYGSGQNFLYDFIWYNPAPTLKGSIEVGNLDQGEFL